MSVKKTPKKTKILLIHFKYSFHSLFSFLFAFFIFGKFKLLSSKNFLFISAKKKKIPKKQCLLLDNTKALIPHDKFPSSVGRVNSLSLPMFVKTLTFLGLISK